MLQFNEPVLPEKQPSEVISTQTAAVVRSRNSGQHVLVWSQPGCSRTAVEVAFFDGIQLTYGCAAYLDAEYVLVRAVPFAALIVEVPRAQA